jgi:hypothetical protein
MGFDVRTTELLAAVYERLINIPDVVEAVGVEGVGNFIPQDAPLPYLRFKIDSSDYSTKTLDAVDSTLIIDIWYAADEGAKKPTELADAIVKGLRREPLDLSSATNLSVEFNDIISFQEPDGTGHTNINFRLLTFADVNSSTNPQLPNTNVILDSGATVVTSFPRENRNGAFLEITTFKDDNSRSETIMSTWDGTSQTVSGSDYATEILNSDPEYYFRFDEANGLAIDSTTNNRDSTITDVTYQADGLILTNPYSFYFDGISNFVEPLRDLNVQGPADEKSVSFWFEPLRVLGRQNLHEEGGEAQGFSVYLDNNILWAGVADANPAEQNFINSKELIIPGKTYHVVFTFNRSIIRLYLDGKLQSSNFASIEQIPLHPNPAGVGAVNSRALNHDGVQNYSGGQGNFFKGYISDVAVWNREITYDEINNHYSGGTSGFVGDKKEITWTNHLTSDIGDTSDVVFSMRYDASYDRIQLISITPEKDWNVKIIRRDI